MTLGATLIFSFAGIIGGRQPFVVGVVFGGVGFKVNFDLIARIGFCACDVISRYPSGDVGVFFERSSERETSVFVGGGVVRGRLGTDYGIREGLSAFIKDDACDGVGGAGC